MPHYILYYSLSIYLKYPLYISASAASYCPALLSLPLSLCRSSLQYDQITFTLFTVWAWKNYKVPSTRVLSALFIWTFRCRCRFVCCATLIVQHLEKFFKNLLALNRNRALAKKINCATYATYFTSLLFFSLALSPALALSVAKLCEQTKVKAAHQ